MDRHDEVQAFGRLRDAGVSPQIELGGRIMMENEAPAEAPAEPRVSPDRRDREDDDHDKDEKHEHPHPRRPPSPRPHGE